MIRYVICPACFSKGRLHLDEQDKSNGYEQRVRALRIKAPDDLDIQVMEGFNKTPIWKETLKQVVCDACNVTIKDGERGYAITHWRASREHTPETWESHYGKIIE